MLKNCYDTSPDKYKLELDYPTYNDSEYSSSIINFIGFNNIVLIWPGHR
jgi:hypothetical protein